MNADNIIADRRKIASLEKQIYNLRNGEFTDYFLAQKRDAELALKIAVEFKACLLMEHPEVKQMSYEEAMWVVDEHADMPESLRKLYQKRNASYQELHNNFFKTQIFKYSTKKMYIWSLKKTRLQ